jgi:hypothetical protein
MWRRQFKLGIGIPVGIFAALHPGSFIDRAVTAAAVDSWRHGRPAHLRSKCRGQCHRYVMAADLAEAATQIAERSDVRAVPIAGNGPNFNWRSSRPACYLRQHRHQESSISHSNNAAISDDGAMHRVL